MSLFDAPKPDKNGIRWYGHNMSRHPQIAGRCIMQVSRGDRMVTFGQCQREAVAGDYCRQHAPPTEKITAWRLNRYAKTPEKIVVAELSNATIRMPDGRREKNGAYYQYFATYAGARAELLRRFRADIVAAEQNLRLALYHLAALEIAVDPPV